MTLIFTVLLKITENPQAGFVFAKLCASALLPELVHIIYSVDKSKHAVQWNTVLLQNDFLRLTLLSLHAPRRFQGYSLKLAGLQILQHSSPCHKLLMDDATPREGCGCLPPEARITDGQWALPLNTRCPWLVCLLILYQWLCKRCTPIIHTDEQAVYSILELQRGPLTLRCWESCAMNAMTSWYSVEVSTTQLDDQRCQEGPALKKNILENGACL